MICCNRCYCSCDCCIDRVRGKLVEAGAEAADDGMLLKLRWLRDTVGVDIERMFARAQKEKDGRDAPARLADEAGQMPSVEPDPDTGREPLTHVAIIFRKKCWSLPRPYRHHDIIRMICWLDPDVDHVDVRGPCQGFLDASGQYLTRRQAQVSAEVNGQIKNGKIIGGELTSEDLW
jgi:hypothetical protein